MLGSMIIKKLCEDNNGIQYEYKRSFAINKSKTLRPDLVTIPGVWADQWPAMAKALMQSRIFADKVEECHQCLNEFGINLKHLLLSEDKNTISTMISKFCSTTAIEIALFEVLKALNIRPEGIIGHSFGEIACAYADGCLTTREALFVTYIRGFITENDKNIPKGLMAFIGLSKSETKKLLPENVFISCNNAKDGVVVSGISMQNNY